MIDENIKLHHHKIHKICKICRENKQNSNAKYSSNTKFISSSTSRIFNNKLFIILSIFQLIHFIQFLPIIKASETNSTLHKNEVILNVNSIFDNDIQLDNITILNEHPSIKLYHNILSDTEVDYLISVAKALLKPSQTGLGIISEVRESSSAELLQDTNDDILMKIRRRFTKLVGYEEGYLEHLQVVYYRDQQYYKPHYDYLIGETLEKQCGNNREHTFLVYLNTIPKKYGGFTKFINLGIKVQPVKGMAVYFRNIEKDGKVNVDTFHSGWRMFDNKDNKLEKWALNVWIRQKNYRKSQYECIKNSNRYKRKEVNELENDDL